ncbi:MAG: hypothetical protein HY231_19255 [Acidobacteria bacterium]|nr:hypothetical protein [Acidobacteriota bacterium]
MAITYVSWNIKQLGPSKLKPTSLIDGVQSLTEIATYILNMNADVVGVMEVTLKESGTDAPKQICNLLGPSWGGVVTSNDASLKPDRYAFFYNTKTVTINQVGFPDFVDINNNPVTFPNRYPALIRFTTVATQKTFGILIIHGPEPAETVGGGALQAMTDLSNLAFVQKPPFPLIISGDFNVDYNLNSTPYTVFENNPLNYSVLFKGNKTSLKMYFNTVDDWGEYVKSAYDNIFLSPGLAATSSAVYDSIKLKAANSMGGLPPYANANPTQQGEWQDILTRTRNRVSDHLAVYATLNI